MEQEQGVVLGLDVGYSNLCMVFDSPPGSGSSQAIVAPAGAGPAALLPRAIVESRLHQRHDPGADGWRVQVGNTLWAAGVEPGRLQGYPRDLHADYPASDSYRALVFAALAATGAARVRLVTGLPASHYQEGRSDLVRRFRGEHRLGPSSTVLVESVTVLPQPVGSYIDFLDVDKHLEIAERSRILVVDVGFFSVDWVLIEQGELRAASSGTSLLAMSVLFQEADDILRGRYGRRHGADRIERAARHSEQHIHVRATKVPLGDLLADAAASVAPRAVTEMRRALRAEDLPDCLLLTGGGAALFEASVASAFADSKVVVPGRPVIANAHGFWLAGRSGA